jgi:cyclopropane fatty-acyl-phospholipid synthase-like methyltransferase
MNIQGFLNIFLDHIKPGSKVLDLGSGDGEFAQMFLERGAIVTAVDTEPPKFQDDKLVVKEMKIEDFCASAENEKYDLIFLRNVIQFLDKSWVLETLFPWLGEHLAQDGLIAIKTFFQEPEPPLSHRTKSLYERRELLSCFMAWSELYSEEVSRFDFDMNGQSHKFFISGLIAKKSN